MEYLLCGSYCPTNWKILAELKKQKICSNRAIAIKNAVPGTLGILYPFQGGSMTSKLEIFA